MNGSHDLFIGLGACHCEYTGVLLFDQLSISTFTHTASHNHTTIFVHGFIDGIKGFLFRGVDKATGIYDHNIGIVVLVYNVVAVKLELGQDAFGVHQGFRAAERHESYFAAAWNCIAFTDTWI